MTRIGLLIVAYNAESTLSQVLDRIPEGFRANVTSILVSDDASVDSTHDVALSYAARHVDLPLVVVRQATNLGYGGNQKAGYHWAIEHDLDIVVLLHGDGQYAPELLPEIVEPIQRGVADCVMGSRMLVPGAARAGGMPLYKYFGNKILTRIENRIAGTDLSEWHSGYRAYRVSALRTVPFDLNSDGFAFDTEIIVQMLEARRRIVEIPIPTYYGDEISYVNGFGYAYEIVRHVARYRLHKMGFGSGDLAFASDVYEGKLDDGSSHALVAARIGSGTSEVLDIGCGSGHLAERLQELGHSVTGIDQHERPAGAHPFAKYVQADLRNGLPGGLGRFDVVVAADVLEHLPCPADLLHSMHEVLAPGGRLVVSIPNFAHWYPRLRVVLGRFDYDRRGILDRTHLRFFTRRSFERLAERAGWKVTMVAMSGIPIDVRDRRADAQGSRIGTRSPKSQVGGELLMMFDRVGRRLWPSLFAYQYVFELSPR